MPDSYSHIEKIFSNAGGEFITPPEQIAGKLAHIKAFLFDWDGVFNAGIKGGAFPSPFSETDSMGTNLLRFGHWLSHGQQLPFVGIITGQKNEAAFEFAKRECFNGVFFNFKNKTAAFERVMSETGLQEHEIAFAFDDVLDLSIAMRCGLRLMVRSHGNPLFTQYVKDTGYTDYITGTTGGGHAVREICELALGLTGMFDKVIKERVSFSDPYRSYLAERNSAQPSTISGE